MILASRNQHYRNQHLTKLIEQKKTLFENWTHDAAIIPIEFYPYWNVVFKRREKRLKQKFGKWQGEGYQRKCKELMRRIKKDGGLMARELERPKTKNKTAMWQWHDGKTALEFLWRTGKLTIAKRQGFQKVYDLSERTVPAKLDKKKIKKNEFIDWACKAAIERLGFGSVSDIAHFWNFLTIDEVKDWVKKQNEKIIKEVEVETHNGECKTLLCRGDIETVMEKMGKCPNIIRALSPFDPVVRDRKRLEWLFGFEYKIEIYVPEKKRKWGYYVFPLLRGDRFVGRIDMKANRKEKMLDVKKVWWEKGIKESETLNRELEKELNRQMKFVGMEKLRWKN